MFPFDINGGGPSVQCQSIPRSEGQLRAVESQVPCYRGSSCGDPAIYVSIGDEKKPENRNKSFTVNVRTLRQGAKALVGQTMTSTIPTPVSEANIELWNNTRKLGLREPWKSPSLFDGATTGPTSTGAEDPTEADRLVKQALQTFVDTPVRNGKILLIDHIPYGWDLNALGDAVLTLVREEERNAMPWSNIESVSVVYEPLEPWLDLHLRRNPTNQFWTVFGRTHFGPRSSGAQGTPSAALFLGIALHILAWTWIKGDGPNSVTWQILVLFTMFFSLALFACGIIVFREILGIKLFDTVLLAQPLAYWHATGLPPSLNRQEALHQIAQQPGYSAVDPSAITLERRTDGWYLQRGVRELEWLAGHRQVLLNAIRQRKYGDLTADIIGFNQRRLTTITPPATR